MFKHFKLGVFIIKLVRLDSLNLKVIQNLVFYTLANVVWLNSFRCRVLLYALFPFLYALFINLFQPGWIIVFIAKVHWRLSMHYSLIYLRDKQVLCSFLCLSSLQLQISCILWIYKWGCFIQYCLNFKLRCWGDWWAWTKLNCFIFLLILIFIPFALCNSEFLLWFLRLSFLLGIIEIKATALELILIHEAISFINELRFVKFFLLFILNCFFILVRLGYPHGCCSILSLQTVNLPRYRIPAISRGIISDFIIELYCALCINACKSPLRAYISWLLQNCLVEN